MQRISISKCSLRAPCSGPCARTSLRDPRAGRLYTLPSLTLIRLVLLFAWLLAGENLGGCAEGESGKAPTAGTSKGTREVSDEVKYLRDLGLPTDNQALFTFLKLRKQGETRYERLETLLDQLTGGTTTQREKASLELLAIGAPALPVLRAATKDPDQRDRARRARECLQILEEQSSELTTTVITLLADRKPTGTVQTFLDFLPSAGDSETLETIRETLEKLAYREGKPHPGLLTAVKEQPKAKDPSGSVSLRRALALKVLFGQGSHRPPIVLGQLLRDPSPAVRMRAALILVQNPERERTPGAVARAVSTLIALLDTLPSEQGGEVLETLQMIAGEKSPKEDLGDDSFTRRKCRNAWAKWWLGTEEDDSHPGGAPLEELKKYTFGLPSHTRAIALIEKLGHSEFDVRAKASRELKAMGTKVIPLLRQALRAPDAEVRRRAREVIEDMTKEKVKPLSPVVLRVLALRKPQGTAKALLAYMPGVDSSSSGSELREVAQRALNAVAYQSSHRPEAGPGRLRPAVASALKSKLGIQRAAAAEAICRGAPHSSVIRPEQISAVHQLLKDPSAGVRYQTALSLIGVPVEQSSVLAQRREAVDALIQLIPEVPVEKAYTINEYLIRLAGKPPKDLPEGETNEIRRKQRDVWKKWWTKNSTLVRLVDPRDSLHERYHGYTLLVSSGSRSIIELDRKGKERFKITGLNNPYDAQVLSNGRVLVAEYSGRRITERNRSGKVLWEKKLKDYPIAVQRLRNGRTFVACQNRMIEITRSGREVQNITHPNVMVARKLRNGQIVAVSGNGTCTYFDRKGKQIRSFRIQVSYYGCEVLPNGNVLTPMGWMNKVMEYDTKGKIVWQANVSRPVAAYRLRNGKTLIATQSAPYRVLELDRSGKQVGEMRMSTYVVRVKRR